MSEEKLLPKPVEELDLPPGMSDAPEPQPIVIPPTVNEHEPEPVVKPPTLRQQSWGTIISMVIIIMMIVVGAFYAWGKRVAEEQQYQQAFSATSTQQ